MATQAKITPCLWFDGNAEEAVRFYTSVFKNSRIVKTSYWGDTGPGPKGSVLTIIFELDGQEFMALNGGPQFKFNEAISLMVNCDTQAEVDELWARLGTGGKEVECGWIKDRYGLAWQIVPRVLGRMIADKDAKKADRVLKAMMGMVKLDIDQLQRAYDGT
ncbi:MAG TPA: VOC family protein [Thermoanaerobaculaceae bacterium]|nr:VOC family protein [Thermoanaerobaculaceae bacterium]